MLTKCLVPATTTSNSLYSSCSTVGLRTNSPFDPADADVGDRREERDVADRDRRAGGDAGEDVRVVLAVEGQDVQVNLHLVHEALGEQRPQRPVDQAGGEDFLGGRPALALHEPAGELARGGAALAVVHLEREEVDPLAGVGADDRAEARRSRRTGRSPSRRPAWRNVPVSMERVRPPIWRSTRMACMKDVLQWPRRGIRADSATDGQSGDTNRVAVGVRLCASVGRPELGPVGRSGPNR